MSSANATHARDRARRQHRNRAGQKDARDDEPGIRVLHGEAHNRDVVEVVREFREKRGL